MKKLPLFGALLACSIPGLIAGSPAAYAEEPVNMTDDTTCWRNQAGAIVSCSGKGRAGNESDRPRGERLYAYPGDRGAIDTGSGPWVSNPGRKVWTIPAINQRWNNPSQPQDWTIPPISKRWGSPSYNPGWSIPPVSKRWNNPR